MRVMHKHPHRETVCNLAWIELRDSYEVVSIDAKSLFRGCTDFEMRMLHKNITGQQITGWLGASMRAVLCELLERLPETDAEPFEASLQAGKVQDGDPPMEYVKGSTTPAKITELFEPLTAPMSPEEPMVAAMGRSRYSDSPVYATQRAAILRSSGSGGSSGTSAQRAPRAPQTSAQRAPRQSGVKDTIWNIADKIWEEAGKPTEKSTILQLRKRMMDILEAEHQVKRTSSSNELGNWQKARV